MCLSIIWRKKQFYWGNCLGCLNGCYMPLVAFYNSYTPTHANSSCQPLNKPLYWTYFVIYEILIKYLLYGRIYRFLFLYFSVLCLTDSVTHVRNSEIKQLSPLFSLCLEILTWCLVYECIMMSYRTNLHFISVQWFLDELMPLDFEIWPNI